jgi:TonB-linked SusC/RagA family outer membrane protein
VVSIRRQWVVCIAVAVLAQRAAPAQSASVSAMKGSAPAAPGFADDQASGANAPVLQSVIALDLHDVPLRTALRELARQIGGRLMYDESVASLARRVTIRNEHIKAGLALREMLRGTDVEIFVPEGGQIVLLKRLPRTSTIDSATVRGRVIDATTKAPVARVVIGIEGLNGRAMSADDGTFTLPNIPPGSYILVTRRLGYAPIRQPITLTSGTDTSIVLLLTAVPNQLEEVVTTGSGERRKLEVGNSITTINADEETRDNAFQNLSDLLASRATGMTITPGGGSPNAPSRWRIRGINSINASNDPIVVIDGVRAASGYPQCRDGNLVGCNQLPSRFDDLDVNDIESIEVLKGPSAAALWGSDASNGVIVIKTKRGRAGPTRWSVRYDEGFTFAPTNLRVPVQGLGTPANGTSVGPCTLLDQALGRCIPLDSTAGGFNRYANPRTTSMATGRMTDVGLTASGGSEALQFYFSGGYRSEVGTSKMPEIDQKIVRQALGMPLPHWMIRPDTRDNANLTARLTGQFSARADYSITAGFIQVTSRAGPDGVMSATSDLRSPADTFELSDGWRQFYVERKHQATRFVGSLAVNWRPLSWLAGRGVIGRDYAYTTSGEYRRRNWCLPFCSTTSQDAKGKVAYGEGQELVETIDLGGTINIPLRRRTVALRTAFGAQRFEAKTQDFGGTAYDIPVGRIDFNLAPSANRTVTQSSDDRATFGMYLEQSIAYRDRLFLNMAVRRDVGSSLGEDVIPVYPKWSLSWLISEEPFFRRLRDRGVSLRLRGAYGHAGIQPGSATKFRTFSQLPRFVESDGTFGSNYATISGVGNADLRPERSVEREGGFELGLWNDRIILDYTAFHKFTRDAIVSRSLAPSLGLSTISEQAYNVGNVRNTGTEAQLTARVLDRRDIQWSVQIGYAARRNTLVTLGPNVEPFTITASNIDVTTVKDDDGVVMPGYPLFGRWARPILGYSDANGDGIITSDEVKLADSLVFIGPSEPKADVAVHSDLAFWNGRIRLGTDFQYVMGFTQLNQYAANMRFFTRSAYDPATPLRTQACIVGASSPFSDDYCFYETVDVLRLRNVSLAFAMPDRVARRFGAQSLTLYVMGANLGVWSDYDGIDPIVNTEDASGNLTRGGAVVPRGKTWTVRAALGF